MPAPLRLGFLTHLHGAAGDRVLALATDLIVQFSPAAPPLDAAITALELLATRVAPALGWKPAAVDVGVGSP
jgi:hypothetical protein